jgi:Flp pilus assembly protein TadD
MRRSIACFALVPTLWLAGCAGKPPAPATPPPAQWFADPLFAPPQAAIDDDIFRPSAAMRAYVDDVIAPLARRRGARQALLDVLGRTARLKLAYDTGYTRNAAEAFDARAGNCLALAIMTASLADMLGVPVRFNAVVVDDTWSRSDNVYFASGHVNLTLSRVTGRGGNPTYDAAEELTIDFLPSQDLRGLRMRTISRDTVLAMYLNNRAAEALASEHVDDAYWWARRAIEREPQALTPYNTLGVIYVQRGAPRRAEALFRYALAHEPSNTKVLFNLAQLLEHSGRAAEAAPLRQRLAALETQPPFEQFDLGIAALKRGDYRAAEEHLQRELDRAADYHEIYSALAVAAFHLGDYRQAWQYMTKALELSTSDRERQIYAAKAEILRKLTHRQ